MRNTMQRRQALLDTFDAHEEMSMLLACLARSPALWDDEDDAEADRIKEGLIERGLLSYADGFVTTTPAGCAALIGYVRGDDVIDDIESEPVHIVTYGYAGETFLNNEQGEE